MGERLYLPIDFPSVELLEEVTVEAIKANGGEANTKQIKDYIVKKLNLSDDILNIEHTDGLTKLIDYRMRWVRTALKNKALIVNSSRGQWSIAK